jgi:cysteine sulfinate desulfinase/cysteine desulfurase-like protein
MSIAAMRKMMMKSSPTAARARLHDFQREAHAVLERAAPAVRAKVGFLDEESRQQVAGGADDLNAVIASVLRAFGAVGEIGELLFDAFFIELIRNEARDPGPNG